MIYSNIYHIYIFSLYIYTCLILLYTCITTCFKYCVFMQPPKCKMYFHSMNWTIKLLFYSKRLLIFDNRFCVILFFTPAPNSTKPGLLEMFTKHSIQPLILFQGGTKLERARDLFEQCLDGCPPKFSKGMISPEICVTLNWCHQKCVSLNYVSQK